MKLAQNRNLGAIILAAGKGKRMNSTDKNKVTLSLVDKPIILHIVKFMKKLAASSIVVVVGFAKESVMKVLEGENVIFAIQKDLLGTGHATRVALKKLPKNITDVIVVYGDDGVIYIDKHLPIINSLFEKHFQTNSEFSFLTIEKDDPTGLGRIVRDKKGKLQEIVEEKDADLEQKKIKEINPGCFIFKVSFLNKYLPKLEKSNATGEYYLTSLIDVAINNMEKVETLRGGKMVWRGVNTREELEEAERLYRSYLKDR